MEPRGEGGEVRDMVDGNRSSGVACGRRAVPPHASEWQPLTAGGNRRVGEHSHTPHTRLVLRGTQNQPKRAKIRAETVQWRWRRVVALASAHTCGRSVFDKISKSIDELQKMI